MFEVRCSNVFFCRGSRCKIRVHSCPFVVNPKSWLVFAPFYGGSVYVWTAVLTITVLGLTLGYYAGGQLSKKRPSERALFIILGVSAVLVLALPLTASISMAFTRGMGLIIGICITCFLLLLPPMLCFGMVGPLVVSLMSLRLESVGKTAGTVYFTSTLGGI